MSGGNLHTAGSVPPSHVDAQFNLGALFEYLGRMMRLERHTPRLPNDTASSHWVYKLIRARALEALEAGGLKTKRTLGQVRLPNAATRHCARVSSLGEGFQNGSQDT